jgi:hypothetical protein
VRRAGVEPAQRCGRVTAAWARRCPADAFSRTVARAGVEPAIDHQGLSPAALPVCVPRRHERLVRGSNPSTPARQADRDPSRATRRRTNSSGGRNRTYAALVQSQVSLPTATTPEAASDRVLGADPAEALSRDGRIRTGVLLHPMQADSSNLSYIPVKAAVQVAEASVG